MHRLVLHNDEIQDAGAKTLAAGQSGLLTGWGVFSTLRIADGVLFAFERHWSRMRRDATRLNVPFPANPEWLESRLLKLVEANGVSNGTLRVNILRNGGGAFDAPPAGRPFDLVAFTRDPSDWGSQARLAIKRHGRHAQSEFAGSKVLSWGYNLRWYEEAQERGFDEVVLLNERGEVSELTSANIFAVEGGQVFTPPLDSGCLAGVTRELLLEEIRVPGISVLERTLLPESLERADAVFITSTTRDLLPVAAIESLTIRSSEEYVIGQLAGALKQYRQAYVAGRQCPTRI
jgi:branched-chain amino acid aminotransferase